MIPRSATAASPPPDQRIEGLAAWRALLILTGVLLHATMGQEDVAAFAALNIVSGSFRMGAFFMISGLLSGFALARRASPEAWMRARLIQLGVPTLFGLAVVAPLIGIANGATGERLWATNPYHIWFLVALLAYTLLGYAIHRVDLSWRVFEQAERRSATARLLQFWTLAGTGLVAFSMMGIAFPVVAAAGADWYPLLRELPLVTGYAPVFLLGFAAARVPTLRRTLTASIRVPLTILAIAAGLLIARYRLSFLFAPYPAWAGGVTVACAAWCPPAATALILRSASAIRRVPRPLQTIADASLTIYILHYPVIVATRMLVGPTAIDRWGLFGLLATVGAAIPYVLHRRLVSRSPWLKLLLNGTPIARSGQVSVPITRGTKPGEGTPAATPTTASVTDSDEALSPAVPGFR